jgi:hypothetical protein
MKIVLMIAEAVLWGLLVWLSMFLIDDIGAGWYVLAIVFTAPLAAFILSICVSRLGGGVFNFISRFFSVEDNDYDETAYSLAESEADSGTYDKGLWSKALVNAKGNEELRKTEYMKLRVMQMKTMKGSK